jgi:hypothetical protein
MSRLPGLFGAGTRADGDKTRQGGAEPAARPAISMYWALTTGRPRDVQGRPPRDPHRGSMPFSLTAEVTSSRNFDKDKAATTVAKITARAKTIHMTAPFENTGVIRASSANASPADPATKTRPIPFLITAAVQNAPRRAKRSSESCARWTFLRTRKVALLNPSLWRVVAINRSGMTVAAARKKSEWSIARS